MGKWGVFEVVGWLVIWRGICGRVGGIGDGGDWGGFGFLGWGCE